MIILGVDPGFKNCGWCLIDTEDPKILGKGTIRNGGLKDWQNGVLDIINKLEKALDKHLFPLPDYISIESISWYGKRRGSLQLAHLAGAIYGWGFRFARESAMLFAPKEVKATTKKYEPPKNRKFNEHEADALSLCRLAVDTLENKKIVADKTKPPR